MLFNSFAFLVFLPVAFLLYWFVFSKSKVSQNIFLLLVSYVFYSFWDWRFSFLLAFSTILDFYSGSIIHNTNDNTIMATTSNDNDGNDNNGSDTDNNDVDSDGTQITSIGTHLKLVWDHGRHERHFTHPNSSLPELILYQGNGYFTAF